MSALRSTLSASFVVTVSVTGCSSTVPSDVVMERYPHSLNAHHEQHGTIYKSGDGSCHVHVPFETPPSSYQPPPSEAVDCPTAMNHPAWNKCIGETLRANDAGDDCVCDVSGNPPPPTVPRVPCP